MEYKIGILALQGGFAKHQEKISQMGLSSQWVSSPQDLHACQGLIIPGGESTVMLQQIEQQGLLQPLLRFAEQRPCMGTCAGLIVMARLGMVHLSVERNAYGRQCSSFSAQLNLTFTPHPVEALFIRAPRIRALLSHQITVLSKLKEDPVLVQQGIHLVASFHPELTKDQTIHMYFKQLIDYSNRSPAEDV